MTRTTLRVGIVGLDLARVCRGDVFMKRGAVGDLDFIYPIVFLDSGISGAIANVHLHRRRAKLIAARAVTRLTVGYRDTCTATVGYLEFSFMYRLFARIFPLTNR